MSDKTFKQRVRDESENFSKIYEFFRNDLQARQQDGLVENNWLHLFGVPFDGMRLKETDEQKAARDDWKIPHKHDAVLKAIQDLGVHNLRLGPLVVSDPRVSAALEMGYLTPSDVVPPAESITSELEGFATRLKPDHGDPVFWRTLLEVLCRAFTASRGRPPWELPAMMDLAFDLFQTRWDYEKKNPNAPKKWNVSDFKAELRLKYAQKYRQTNSVAGLEPVGEDRIQQILTLVGPMNTDSLAKLRDLFPDEFQKVADRRLFREKVQNDGLLHVLGDALDVIDIVSDRSDDADRD